MNSSRVVTALREALQSMSSDPRTFLPTRIRSVVPDELVLEMAISEAVAPVIQAEAPFDEGGFMISTGIGGMAFRHHEAARYLARRIEDGRTPEGAVADLDALLASEQAESMAVLALWGVTVESEVKLTDDLALVPFDAVPNSLPKTRMDRHVDDPMTPTLFQQPPDCALCCRFITSPVLRRSADVWPEPPRPYPAERLRDAALPISLVGPSLAFAGPSWNQYVNPLVERAQLGATMSLLLLDASPHWLGRAVTLNPDATMQVVRDYLRTSGKLRSRLRLSLTRFNKAMTRSDLGAKALDLAIALEALLVDTEGEHAFKTALRAGLLMDGSTSQRVRARSLVSALYRIRSAVVHSGEAPSNADVAGSGKEPSAQVVYEAERVTAAVLRRVLRDGHIPDWTTFDLGNSVDNV